MKFELVATEFFIRQIEKLENKIRPEGGFCSLVQFTLHKSEEINSEFELT